MAAPLLCVGQGFKCLARRNHSLCNRLVGIKRRVAIAVVTDDGDRLAFVRPEQVEAGVREGRIRLVDLRPPTAVAAAGAGATTDDVSPVNVTDLTRHLPAPVRLCESAYGFAYWLLC